MRKTFIVITVIALIVSVVGTGVVVFIETSNPTTESSDTVETPAL